MYTEPTKDQNRQLAAIRKEFGSAISRTYRIDRRTGNMIVKAQCALGTWVWTFNQWGRMVDRYLQTELTLDTDDATTTRSGALPRNAQDDNDT